MGKASLVGKGGGWPPDTGPGRLDLDPTPLQACWPTWTRSKHRANPCSTGTRIAVFAGAGSTVGKRTPPVRWNIGPCNRHRPMWLPLPGAFPLPELSLPTRTAAWSRVRAPHWKRWLLAAAMDNGRRGFIGDFRLSGSRRSISMRGWRVIAGCAARSPMPFGAKAPCARLTEFPAISFRALSVSSFLVLSFPSGRKSTDWPDRKVSCRWLITSRRHKITLPLKAAPRRGGCRCRAFFGSARAIPLCTSGLASAPLPRPCWFSDFSPPPRRSWRGSATCPSSRPSPSF